VIKRGGAASKDKKLGSTLRDAINEIKGKSPDSPIAPPSASTGFPNPLGGSGSRVGGGEAKRLKTLVQTEKETASDRARRAKLAIKNLKNSELVDQLYKEHTNA